MNICLGIRNNCRKLIVFLAVAVCATSQSANAQDNCLQRRLGTPPAPFVSHWVVTNRCSYAVEFKAYMSGEGGTYQVYTTPLGKLIDPNPGFPITVTLRPRAEQSFYFRPPPFTAGQWNLITDNVSQVSQAPPAAVASPPRPRAAASNPPAPTQYGGRRFSGSSQLRVLKRYPQVQITNHTDETSKIGFMYLQNGVLVFSGWIPIDSGVTKRITIPTTDPRAYHRAIPGPNCLLQRSTYTDNFLIGDETVGFFASGFNEDSLWEIHLRCPKAGSAGTARGRRVPNEGRPGSLP
jgi:hypothetical protein